MNEVTKKLLLALGLTSVQIADLETETPTLDVELTVKAVKETNIKLLKNDPELMEQIRAAEKGKNLDEFQRYIKKTFGLSADEIKDKKVDEIIQIAKDKISTGTDQTLQDLQKENVELKNKLNTLETETIPTIKSEVDIHKKKFNINNALTKKLADMTLRNPIEVVIRQLDLEFGDKYDIDLSDSGELTIRDKKTKLEVRNTDGTKLLTSDEILQESLSRNKFLEESGAPEGGGSLGFKPKQQKEEADKSKTEAFAPGLSAAEKHLAQMQEQKAKETK